MTSPDVAAVLTRQYQVGQRRISRVLLADLLRLWRAVVDPDDFATFLQFAELAARLVGDQRAESTQAAARFYEMFRATQVVPASAAAALAAQAAPVAPFAPVEAPPVEESIVTGLLRGAVLAGFLNGRRAGQTERRALDNALVKTSGTASRLMLNGGRETILASVRADEEALGWVRVPDADPCAFCRTLASRGEVYKSAETAGRRANRRFEGEGAFKFHDHCGCTVVPTYLDTPIPASVDRYEAEYKAAQKWARETGFSDPSRKNYALVNYRAYLEHLRS